MANQPHLFKNRDITRCLKSALAAGVEDPVVRIRLSNGTEYVVGGSGGKAAGGKKEAVAPALSSKQRASSPAPSRGQARPRVGR